ncbi:hypothetical protein ACIF6I_33410 [Streptomyces microflavus]|uniref:hypothetical protein n=1 Tax=Streptomyces microflavus TaxID=1919 RepID=UPI0037D15FE4
MSATHTQRLREEAERRRLARERREADKQSTATDGGDGPPKSQLGAEPAGQVEATNGAGKAAKRPQPFTPDLLPATDATNATGSLSAEELDELDRCERAFANADQAQWMRGLALHAVRERRLYRQGGRTWVEYCEEIGLSESEAHRLIQEYPLTRAISQIWETPKIVAASHVRALLPLVPDYGLDSVAQGYAHLRVWAQQNQQKVTAADLTALVERAALGNAAAGGPLPVAEFQARRKALEASVPAQAGPPPGDAASAVPERPTPATSSGAQPDSGPLAGETESRQDHPRSSGAEEEADGAEPEILDAEIVSDEEAKAVLAALQGLQQNIGAKLEGASSETLISIAACARAVDEAARAALGR